MSASTQPASPRAEGLITGHPKMSTVLIGSLIALLIAIVIGAGVVYYYAAEPDDPVEAEEPGLVVEPDVFTNE